MSYRTNKSGLARDVQLKMKAKYDENLASEILEWIKEIVGEPSNTSGDEDNFYNQLKDGIVLHKLADVLTTGRVGANYRKSLNSFIAGEHYTKFFDKLSKILSINEDEKFVTVDLYERTALYTVVVSLSAIGRKAHKIGKGFGPKESIGEKRNFTEEQLRQGNSIIGLQMGSNKGASQSGMNIGKPRSVVD